MKHVEKSFVLGVILLVLFVGAAFAQSPEKSSWVKLRAFKNDLTMDVPSENLYDKDGDRSLFFAEGQGMWVYMAILSADAKSFLRDSRSMEDPDDFNCPHITVAKSEGEVCTGNKDGFLMKINLGTSHAFYQISIASASSETKDLRRFMSSLKVADQQLFKTFNPATTEDVPELALDSLTSSPECVSAINRDEVGGIRVVYDEGGSSETTSDTIKYSRPLLILRQPPASFTKRALQTLTKSNVKLRVVFEGNGQISQITVLHAAEPDLTSNAIEAAKEIKFIPAKVGNESITVSRVFHYAFNIRPWPARPPNWKSQLPK